MHYHQMKRSVGVAVLLLIILIIIFMSFIVKEKGYFAKRYAYYFVVDDASSLSVDTPLNYAGLMIGTIYEIELLKSGQAKIYFFLNKKNRYWIRENTILTIKRPLIGSSYIEISSIDIDSPILKPNAFLKVEMSNDINDLIERLEPIVQKSTNILTNIEKITNHLADNHSPLKQSIKNIQTITAKLAKDEALLTTLSGDKNMTTSFIRAINHLESIFKNTHQVSNDFSKISATLDKKIVMPTASTIKDVNKIMKDIRDKLSLLHGTVQELGKYKEGLGHYKKEIFSTIHKSHLLINRINKILMDDSSIEIELP